MDFLLASGARKVYTVLSPVELSPANFLDPLRSERRPAAVREYRTPSVLLKQPVLLSPETLKQLFPQSFLFIDGIDAATFGAHVQRNPRDQERDYFAGRFWPSTIRSSDEQDE